MSLGATGPVIQTIEIDWTPFTFETYLSQIDTAEVALRGRTEDSLFNLTFGMTYNELIDDFIKNIQEWRRAGGIGIHHVGAQSTIKKLAELGIEKNINRRK